MPRTVDLKVRNALWRRLRSLSPGTRDFEAAVHEVSALTGWDRARVLAALGLDGPAPTPHADPGAGDP